MTMLMPDRVASLTQRDPDDRHAAMTEAIRRACSFLEYAQLGNGRWLDFRCERLISSQWVTAYVGAQVARAGRFTAAVNRACEYLLAHQQPGGGWGFNLANPADADSIANVIHFLVQCRRDEAVAAAIDKGVALLSRYWVESAAGYRTYHPIAGDGFRTADSSWCDVHPSVTAMCATALAAIDHDAHRRTIEACAGNLRLLQRADGLWDAFWWDGATYATYHAARLLAHVGDADRVARACDGLLGIRRGDGGWGDSAGSESAPFHTALAASTLLLDAGRHHAAVDDALAWLVRAQQADGSWPAVPILRVPRPQVHQPWRECGDILIGSLTPDRNRLFTTATALSALLDGCRALAASS